MPIAVARVSFRLKVALAAVLVVLADLLFFLKPAGAVLGGFALAWVVVVATARPGLVHDRRAALALIAASALAGIMIDRPGLVATALFVIALAVAVLSARVRAGEPAWRWGQRLLAHAVAAAAAPLRDAMALRRLRRLGGTGAGRGPVVARTLLLPLAGGAVFLALFASANPLIADLLDRLRPPPLSGETILRVLFWGVVGAGVWATLRPRWRRRLLELPAAPASLSGPGAASVILSLVVFNAVFALQNGLDVAFLWSGAPLPGEITLADYAQRGAWTLMFTALLAGLFVLVALRPGSEPARRPLVRRLVAVWVAQNLLLVASSLLRTANYVEAFGLTRFRIAAMIWMAMVAAGLGLICWRLWRERDGHWLIDANVRMTLIVLAGVAVVDLGAVAAAWNVRHAGEVDGTGAGLDLAYLRGLDGAALVSLVELEERVADPALRDRIVAARTPGLDRMRARQADWRAWTFRDARRLRRIDALLRDRRAAPTPARPLTLIEGG